MKIPAAILASAILTLPLAPAPATAAEPIPPGHAKQMARSLSLFKTEVRPILKNTCIECHGGKKVRSGLNLNTREGLLEGGDNGPAVVLGDSANSLLVALIEHRDEPFMPKSEEEKLDDRQIATIAEWIDTGAAFDKPILAPGLAAATAGPMVVTDDDREFWSFKPLGPPAPPEAGQGTWSHHPIDRFLAAKQEENGLAPSPEADPRKLVRRIYFDLIGLPPTPEEVDRWSSRFGVPGDRRNAKLHPQAIAELIDELLDSPHFGEKWARHWLDVARFAESHGFEQDYNRPYAYHYRDFVIQAFNEDMPYDQFVKWQLAGDEFAPDDTRALMATGFLGAGVFPTQLTEKEFESARYDELDDMAATTGTAFLGLTIGCARCHDHKYDPIPVKDYYRLLSTFSTTIRSEVFLPAGPEAAKRELKAWEKEHLALEKAVHESEARSGTGAELKKRNKALKDHLAAKPPPDTAKVQVTSEGFPPTKHHADGRGFPHFYPKTYFLTRGDANQKGEEAPQGFLQVLLRDGKTESHWQKKPPENSRTSYRRTALANWMTDVEHGAGPLLARVIVNRLWHHHFGRGLVATPSDFGYQGARPTHPELLDFLAGELIQNGWRLKPIHKLIMLSAAYRQDSAPDPAKARIDPENQFLWRFTPRRLEAESIRDSLLALSGTLDREMFGPGSLDPANPRRSVYLMIKRSQLIPMMQVFDSPEPLVSQGSRPSTTIAPQALIFMNNLEVRQWVDAFATRVDEAAPDSFEDAIGHAYRIALSRPPDGTEFAEAVAFLEDQVVDYKHAGRSDARLLALGDLCQVLVSLNEFAYIE